MGKVLVKICETESSGAAASRGEGGPDGRNPADSPGSRRLPPLQRLCSSQAVRSPRRS